MDWPSDAGRRPLSAGLRPSAAPRAAARPLTAGFSRSETGPRRALRAVGLNRPLSGGGSSRSADGSVGYSAASTPVFRITVDEPNATSKRFSVASVGPRPDERGDRTRLRDRVEALRRGVAERATTAEARASRGGCAVVVDLTSCPTGDEAASAAAALREAGLRCCVAKSADWCRKGGLSAFVASCPVRSEAFVVLWLVVDLDGDGEPAGVPADELLSAERSLTAFPRRLLWVVEGRTELREDLPVCCAATLPLTGAASTCTDVVRAARSEAAQVAALSQVELLPQPDGVYALCTSAQVGTPPLSEVLRAAASALPQPSSGRDGLLLAMATAAAESAGMRARSGRVPPPRGLPALPGRCCAVAVPVGGVRSEVGARLAATGGQCPADSLPGPLAGWWRAVWRRQGAVPWPRFLCAARAALSALATDGQTVSAGALHKACADGGIVTTASLLAALPSSASELTVGAVLQRLSEEQDSPSPPAAIITVPSLSMTATRRSTPPPSPGRSPRSFRRTGPLSPQAPRSPADEEVLAIVNALRDSAAAVDDACCNLVAAASARRRGAKAAGASSDDGGTGSGLASVAQLVLPGLGGSPGRRRQGVSAPVSASSASLAEIATQLQNDAEPQALLEWLLGRKVSGHQDAADAVWRFPLPDNARLFVVSLRVCRRLWGDVGDGLLFGAVEQLRYSAVTRQALDDDAEDTGGVVLLPDKAAERGLFHKIARLYVKQRKAAHHRQLPLLWRTEEGGFMKLNGDASQPVSLRYDVTLTPGHATVVMRAKFNAVPPQGPVLVAAPVRRKFALKLTNRALQQRLQRALRQTAADTGPPCSCFVISLPAAPGRRVVSVRVTRGGVEWGSTGGAVSDGGSAQHLRGSDFSFDGMEGDTALRSCYSLDAILVPMSGPICASAADQFEAEITFAEPLLWDADRCQYGPLVLPSTFRRALADLAGPVAASEWLQGVLRVAVRSTLPRPMTVASTSHQLTSTVRDVRASAASVLHNADTRLAGTGLWANTSVCLTVAGGHRPPAAIPVAVLAPYRLAAARGGADESLLQVHVTPPGGSGHEARRFTQAVVFVVDCSAQMGPAALAAARRGVLRGMKRLSDDFGDGVALLSWSSAPRREADAPRGWPATAPDTQLRSAGGAGARAVRVALKALRCADGVARFPALTEVLRTAAGMLTEWAGDGKRQVLRTVVLVTAGSCAAEEAAATEQLAGGSSQWCRAGIRVRMVAAGPHANCLFATHLAASTRTSLPYPYAVAGSPAELALAIEGAAAAAVGTWLTDVRVSTEGPVAVARPHSAPPVRQCPPKPQRSDTTRGQLRQWQLPARAADLTTRAAADVVVRLSGRPPSVVLLNGRLANGSEWCESTPVVPARRAAALVSASAAGAALPHAAAAVWADARSVTLSATATQLPAGVTLRMRAADRGGALPSMHEAAAVVALLADCRPADVGVLRVTRQPGSGAADCELRLSAEAARRLAGACCCDGGREVGPWRCNTTAPTPPEFATTRARRLLELSALAGDARAAGAAGLPLYDGQSGPEPAACSLSAPPLLEGSEWASEVGLAACGAIAPLAPGCAPLLTAPPF